MEDKMTPFRRKIYDTMLKWKQERNGDSALLIEGARRVGKSTIVEESSAVVNISRIYSLISQRSLRRYMICSRMFLTLIIFS